MTDEPKRPSLEELSRRSGLSASLIGKRLRMGWSVEEALSTPAASLSQRGKMSRAKTKFQFQYRGKSDRAVNVVPKS